MTLDPKDFSWVPVTVPSQLTHLAVMRGKIRGYEFVGLLCIEDENRFLCQNAYDGCRAENRHGFRYSYTLGRPDTADEDLLNRVYDDITGYLVSWDARNLERGYPICPHRAVR